MCGTHYRQFQRGARDSGGNLLREVRAKLPNGAEKPLCKMVGCGNESFALGLCTTHKSQHWLGIIDEDGNALREMKIAPRGTYRIVTKKGYVRIYMPEHHRADAGGYTWEHIVVLEQRLGRTLIEGEITHHKNGDREDNSPSNLELRTTYTHEPGHTICVAIAVETLQLSEEPWDRGVLLQILAGESVLLPGTPPDPLGGLTPSIVRGIQRALPGEALCCVPGCPGAAKAAKGMCWGHYYRLRRGIADASGNLKLREGGLPYGALYTEQGYVNIRLIGHSEVGSSGYALAHRAVMSNFLQRPLNEGEVVHHRNGNRADNRIENLQLLATRMLDARGYVRSPVEALRILAVTYPACLDYQEQLLAA